jgi:hypothetical protein
MTTVCTSENFLCLIQFWNHSKHRRDSEKHCSKPILFHFIREQTTNTDTRERGELLGISFSFLNRKLRDKIPEANSNSHPFIFAFVLHHNLHYYPFFIFYDNGLVGRYPFVWEWRTGDFTPNVVCWLKLESFEWNSDLKLCYLLASAALTLASIFKKTLTILFICIDF